MGIDGRQAGGCGAHNLRQAFLEALESSWAGKGACLICSGSPTGVSPDLLWNLAMWNDEIIAVDSGLEWLERANITPELMVGDMDSVDAELYNRYEVMGVSAIVTSPVKDDTDLEIALMCVGERFRTMAVVANFAGGRLDHELASLGSMGRAGFPVVAVDEHAAVVFLEAAGADAVSAQFGDAGSGCGPAPVPSRIELSQIGLQPGDEYSVIAYDGSATVSQSGVRYPQESVEMPGISGRGVSNVVISPDAAVEAERGKAMLVLTF